MSDRLTTLLVLLGVLAIPLVACGLIVFGDPGVETSLIRALAITFVIAGGFTLAVFAVFLAREGRLGRDIARLTGADRSEG